MLNQDRVFTQPNPPGVHHKSILQASNLHFDTNVAKLQLVLFCRKRRIEHSLPIPPVAYSERIAIRKPQQFALHAM